MSAFTPDDATAFRPTDSRPRGGEHRFAPGTIVSGRYRIVSMAGAGGMGEVYRADDLKLSQPVALKFLPRNIEGSAVERLYGEARVGRQISHPNVCRLYDVGEAEGHHFITMEFVDGEDLASLLRRIGRLPPDKAVAIARDICAGLAAAHDKGIVHRDLKPANIMVDGRGTARVTDFGLAEIAREGMPASRELAGTPAYMAPEQLDGGLTTNRTDIYALGVVLYEVFTGHRLFTGRTLAELREQHALAKTRPSSVISEIDPAVERLILRCLEEEPELRPPTMQAVMAALPGGDPLQAAIAAGETPSPQMVAAAAEAGDLSAGRAWLVAAVVALALFAGAWANDRASVAGLISEVRSRDALSDRAREIIGHLGYARGRDNASWYSSNNAYLAHLKRSGSLRELRSSPPGALLFVYRESSETLRPEGVVARVTATDPAPVEPGDTLVELDHEGRLREFKRVPPVNAAMAPEPAPWSAAFRDAGLDMARFTAAVPLATPPSGSDRRYAWTGTYHERPDIQLRVEAASLAGRPVFFRVVEPWPVYASRSRDVGRNSFAVVSFLVTIAAAVIARRNAARGRGDVRGARRIAVAMAIAYFIVGLAAAHHVRQPYGEYEVYQSAASQALYQALFAFVAYLAVEPYVRRRWPKMLIGTTRLLGGRARDPLVGREVLYGLATGAAGFAIARGIHGVAVASGVVIPLNTLAMTTGTATVPLAFALSFSFAMAAMYTLGFLALAILLRFTTRHRVVLYAVLPLVYAAMNVGNYGWIDFAGALIVGGLATYATFRFGAISGWIAGSANFFLRQSALTLRFDAPHAGFGISAAVALALLAAWAFHVSLGGKPLFGSIAAEEEAAAQ